MKDGVLSATFQYPTGGKEAIENALKILNAEGREEYHARHPHLHAGHTVSQGGKEL